MPFQSPQIEKRRIGVAIDINEESAKAVKWAVSSYLQPEDLVIVLHVQPTDALYGADWGDTVKNADTKGAAVDSRQPIGDDAFNVLASSKVIKPIVDAQIPYKMHIVKDYDRKERICLEAERLKLNALIMGSRRAGVTTQVDSESVSEYCVHHCECPVVVVRYHGDESLDQLEEEATQLHLDSKI